MRASQRHLSGGRVLPVLAALILIALNSVRAQVPTQQLVIPHFAVGEGWETDLTLAAQGSQLSSGVVQFFAQNGFPQEISVSDSAPVPLIEYTLEPGSAVTYRLSTPGALQAGYIIVNSTLEGTARGAIGALVTYRLVRDGQVLSQVGVPPADFYRAGVLLFDNAGGNRTALAIAANAFDDSSIRFSRFTHEGDFIEASVMDFPAGSQHALFVDELFEDAAGLRGIILAEADAVFNWISLNLNGTVLSSAPPLPEVLERDLRLLPEQGVASDWKLRLIRSSGSLVGVADRLDPSPAPEFLVSGTLLGAGFYGTTRGSLSINIASREGDTAQVIALIARYEDPTLSDEITGTFIFHDDSGNVVEKGTFRLTRPPTAPI